MLSHPEGRRARVGSGLSGGARRPKTTGHKARVMGGHRAEYAFYLAFVRVYVTPSQRRMPREGGRGFFLQREKERGLVQRLLRQMCRRRGICPLTAAVAKGAATVGRMFRFNKG